jgi:hypothetical protein
MEGKFPWVGLLLFFNIPPFPIKGIPTFGDGTFGDVNFGDSVLSKFFQN